MVCQTRIALMRCDAALMPISFRLEPRIQPQSGDGRRKHVEDRGRNGSGVTPTTKLPTSSWRHTCHRVNNEFIVSIVRHTLPCELLLEVGGARAAGGDGKGLSAQQRPRVGRKGAHVQPRILRRRQHPGPDCVHRLRIMNAAIHQHRNCGASTQMQVWRYGRQTGSLDATSFCRSVGPAPRKSHSRCPLKLTGRCAQTKEQGAAGCLR